MTSGSLLARGKEKVDENQVTDGNDIFGYMQSRSYLMKYTNEDELEIYPEEEVQVNTSTQRSQTQVSNRGEEDNASKNIKV